MMNLSTKLKTRLDNAAGTPVIQRRYRRMTAVATLLLTLLIVGLLAALGRASRRATASEPKILRIEVAQTTPVLFALVATPPPSGDSSSIRISQYTQLHLGDDYPAVQQLQSQLSALGYLDTDEPDTVYSAALADAVSLFQRAHGLTVNGEADAAVQEKLFDGEALVYRVQLGDQGDDVTGLQTALAHLGYFSGKATGYFGSATEAAVLAFQQGNGLSPDGVFDADDRDALYSPTAKAAVPATSTPTPEATKRPAEKSAAPEKTLPAQKTPVPTAVPVEAPLTPVELAPIVLPVLEMQAPPATAIDSDMPPTEPVLTPVTEPVTEPVTVPAEAQQSNDGDSSGNVVEGIIDTARAQVGKPYRRGSEGPNSYDCSGLVYYCLTQNGIQIGRYSAANYAKVTDWKKITDMSDLRRGDLIFYHDDDSSGVSHVGICLGDGTMIDASSNKSQIVHRAYDTSYWRRNFVCGRRVV